MGAVTSLMTTQDTDGSLEHAESTSKCRMRKLQQTASIQQEALSDNPGGNATALTPPSTQETDRSAEKVERALSVEPQEVEIREHAVIESPLPAEIECSPVETAKPVTK